MNERLENLNGDLQRVLDDLHGDYAVDVAALQHLSQNLTGIARPCAVVARTIELLNAIQSELTPPLHTLVDSMFGMYILRML
jgi:hypothetical protein